MDQLLEFIRSIDWIFAAVILIGGRYWGGKFFNITKNGALNFLFFATAFATLWIGIKYFTGDIDKGMVKNLFITFLFTTSFYEMLAKKLFEKIEKLISGDKQ